MHRSGFVDAVVKLDKFKYVWIYVPECEDR